MTSEPDVTVDPDDFDAVGVMTEVIVSLRAHTMEQALDSIATVSAPPGRHVVRVIARPGGHTVLAVRFDDLTLSRRNVLADGLARRGWDLDEDAEGATRRLPPGTDASDAAFALLPILTLGGAPAERRTVTAVDARGAAIPIITS
jgi:hypothetical protein